MPPPNFNCAHCPSVWRLFYAFLRINVKYLGEMNEGRSHLSAEQKMESTGLIVSYSISLYPFLKYWAELTSESLGFLTLVKELLFPFPQCYRRMQPSLSTKAVPTCAFVFQLPKFCCYSFPIFFVIVVYFEMSFYGFQKIKMFNEGANFSTFRNSSQCFLIF